MKWIRKNKITVFTNDEISAAIILVARMDVKENDPEKVKSLIHKAKSHVVKEDREHSDYYYCPVFEIDP